MNFDAELSLLFSHQYGVLLLDNEVTVGHFVTQPPVVWSRLVQQDGVYQVPHGYPVPLTAEQAQREMRIWDPVSIPGIMTALQQLRESVDTIVIGNNAGQGLPLAEKLPAILRGSRAAIIYGESLPETRAYQESGYSTLLKRSALLNHLFSQSKSARLPLAVAFMNTIQHDASNFHEP